MRCISLKELLFFISIWHVSQEMKDILEEIQPSEDNPSDLNAFFEDVMKFKKAFKMIRRAAAEADADSPMSRNRRDKDIDEYVYDEDNFVANTKKSQNGKHKPSSNKMSSIQKSNRPLNDIYPHIYKEHSDQEYVDKYLENLDFDKGPRYRRELAEGVEVEPKSTNGNIAVVGEKARMVNSKNKAELMEDDAQEALMTIFSQLEKSTQPAHEGTTPSSKPKLSATDTTKSQNTFDVPVNIFLATTTTLNTEPSPTRDAKRSPTDQKDKDKRELKIDIIKNGKLVKEYSSNDIENESMPCDRPKQTSISLNIVQPAEVPNVMNTKKEHTDCVRNNLEGVKAGLEHFEKVESMEIPPSVSAVRRTLEPTEFVQDIPKFVGSIIDEIQSNYRGDVPKITRSNQYHYRPYMKPVYSEDPRSIYYAKDLKNMIYNTPYYQEVNRQNLINDEDDRDIPLMQPQENMNRFLSRSLMSLNSAKDDPSNTKRNVQEILGMDNEDDYMEDLAFKTESPSTIKFAKEDDEISSVRTLIKSKKNTKATPTNSAEDLYFPTSTPASIATTLTLVRDSSTASATTTRNSIGTLIPRKKRAKKYRKMKRHKLLSRLKKRCNTCLGTQREIREENLGEGDSNLLRCKRQQYNVFEEAISNFHDDKFNDINRQKRQNPFFDKKNSRDSVNFPTYQQKYQNEGDEYYFPNNIWDNSLDPSELYQKMRYFHFRPYSSDYQQYRNSYPNSYEDSKRRQTLYHLKPNYMKYDRRKRRCDRSCCRKLMARSNCTIKEHDIQKRDVIDGLDDDEVNDPTEIIEKRTESDYGEEPDLSEGQSFKKHSKLKKHSKVMAPSKNFEDNYEYEEVPNGKTSSFLGFNKNCYPKKKCKKKKFKLKKGDQHTCQVSFRDRLAQLKNKLFSSQPEETETDLREEIPYNAQYDEYRRSERQSEPTRLKDQDNSFTGSSKRIESAADSDNKRQCYDQCRNPSDPNPPLFPPCQRPYYTCPYEPCPCDPCPSKPCPSGPPPCDPYPCQPYCCDPCPVEPCPPRPCATYPCPSSCERCPNLCMPSPSVPCPCDPCTCPVPEPCPTPCPHPCQPCPCPYPCPSTNDIFQDVEDMNKIESHIKERCPSYFDPCPPCDPYACSPPFPFPYQLSCSYPCTPPPPCLSPCFTSFEGKKDDEIRENDPVEAHIISERSSDSFSDSVNSNPFKVQERESKIDDQPTPNMHEGHKIEDRSTEDTSFHKIHDRSSNICDCPCPCDTCPSPCPCIPYPCPCPCDPGPCPCDPCSCPCPWNPCSCPCSCDPCPRPCDPCPYPVSCNPCPCNVPSSFPCQCPCMQKRDMGYNYQEIEGRCPSIYCDPIPCPCPCSCPIPYLPSYSVPCPYVYSCYGDEDESNNENSQIHGIKERCPYPCPDPSSCPGPEPTCYPCPCSFPCPFPISCPCPSPCPNTRPCPCPSPCVKSNAAQYIREKNLNLRNAEMLYPSDSNESDKNIYPEAVKRCYSNSPCPNTVHKDSCPSSSLSSPPQCQPSPSQCPPCPSPCPPCPSTCPPSPSSCPPSPSPCPPCPSLGPSSSSPSQPPSPPCPPCPPPCQPCPPTSPSCPPPCQPCTPPPEPYNQSCPDPCEPQNPDDNNDNADIHDRNDRSSPHESEFINSYSKEGKESNFSKDDKKRDIKELCTHLRSPSYSILPPFLSKIAEQESEDFDKQQPSSSNTFDSCQPILSPCLCPIPSPCLFPTPCSNSHSTPLSCLHNDYVSSPYFTQNAIHCIKKRSGDPCPPGYIWIQPHSCPNPNTCPEIPSPCPDIVCPPCPCPLPESPLPVPCIPISASPKPCLQPSFNEYEAEQIVKQRLSEYSTSVPINDRAKITKRCSPESACPYPCVLPCPYPNPIPCTTDEFREENLHGVNERCPPPLSSCKFPCPYPCSPCPQPFPICCDPCPCPCPCPIPPPCPIPTPCRFSYSMPCRRQIQNPTLSHELSERCVIGLFRIPSPCSIINLPNPFKSCGTCIPCEKGESIDSGVPGASEGTSGTCGSLVPCSSCSCGWPCKRHSELHITYPEFTLPNCFTSFHDCGLTSIPGTFPNPEICCCIPELCPLPSSCHIPYSMPPCNIDYGIPCPCEYLKKRCAFPYPYSVFLSGLCANPEICSIPELKPLPSSNHYPTFPVPCAVTYPIACPYSYLGKRSNVLIPCFSRMFFPSVSKENNFNSAPDSSNLKQEHQKESDAHLKSDGRSEYKEQNGNQNGHDAKRSTEKETSRVKRDWLCPKSAINCPKSEHSRNCLDCCIPSYCIDSVSFNDPYSCYEPICQSPCCARNFYNCFDRYNCNDAETDDFQSSCSEPCIVSEPAFQSDGSEFSCPPWYWNCDIIGPCRCKCPTGGNRLSVHRRSNTLQPAIILPSTASASDLIAGPEFDNGEKEKRKCPKPCEPLPPCTVRPPPLPLPCDDTTNDMLAQRARQVNAYLKNQYLSGRYTMNNQKVPRSRRQLSPFDSSNLAKVSQIEPSDRQVRRPHGVPKKLPNKKLPTQNEDLKYLKNFIDDKNRAGSQKPHYICKRRNIGMGEKDSYQMEKIHRRNCDGQSNPNAEGKSKIDLSPEDFMLLRKKSNSEYQDMHFAKEIVEAVMRKVNKNANLKIKIGNALNKKRIYETENNQRTYIKECSFEDRAEYEEAKNLLRTVSCVLNKLVKKQIEEKLCEKLPGHLKSFLKRIVRPPKHRINQRHDDKYHEDTFLFRASCPPAKLDPDTRSQLEMNLVKLLDRYNQLDEDSRKRAAPLKSYISNHLDMLKKIDDETFNTESPTMSPDGYMESNDSPRVHTKNNPDESKFDSSLNSRNSLNNLDNMEKDLENLEVDKKRTPFQQPPFGMNSFTPVKITEEDNSIENKLKKRNTDKLTLNEKNPHKRAKNADSTSDKYKKLVKAAEEVRFKRKNEEKIGEAFGNRKVDDNDPDAKEQDDPVAFERPLVYRT